MMVSGCASPSPIKGEEIAGASRGGVIHHALGLDSRFRGNDRRGAAGRCQGLGCPQVLFSSPQEWGTKGVENIICLTMAPLDIMRPFECEKV